MWLTFPNFLISSKVSSLCAALTTGDVRTCVCWPRMEGSTAVAVATESFWRTTPAQVIQHRDPEKRKVWLKNFAEVPGKIKI